MIGAPPSKRTGRRPAWSKSRSSVMSWTDVKRRRWPTGDRMPTGCAMRLRTGKFPPVSSRNKTGKSKSRMPNCAIANRHRIDRAKRILRALARDGWRCAWCSGPVPLFRRVDAVFCSDGCRKRAARQRHKFIPQLRLATSDQWGEPL